MRRFVVSAIGLAAVLLLPSCNESPHRNDKVEIAGSMGTAIRLNHTVSSVPRTSIPIKLERNAAETSYRSETAVADHQKLVVWPSTGSDPVELTGSPLTATYYHVGKVLIVEAGQDEQSRFHYFTSPVRWSTVDRKE